MQLKTQGENMSDWVRFEETGYWFDSTDWASESWIPRKMSSFSTLVVYSCDKEMG
jgi:hypothetical protein